MTLGLVVLHLDAPVVIGIITILVLGAIAQSVTGFGFSLVSAPILVLLVGPAPAVRLINGLAMVLNVVLLLRERRLANVRFAMQLLIPAIVATPLAAYAVHRANPEALSVVIGVLIIASALALASGRRAHALRAKRGIAAAGGLSAIMNTASGVGGPAVAMYALNAEWPLDATRPTLQIYFLGLNILSFVALGPTTATALPQAGFVAAILGGLTIGATVARRLSLQAVRSAVLALAIAGGSAAVARGLAG